MLQFNLHPISISTTSGDLSPAARQSDYLNHFITKVMRPVVIIPGCFGSQITATSKATGKVSAGWLNISPIPKLMAGESVIAHLWGRFDGTNMRSFSEEFYDTKVVLGEDGCGRLVSNKFISKIVKAQYMSPLMRSLEQIGYVAGRDLFCFPYDWRQASFNTQLLSNLRELLEHVKAETKKSAIIISHSGGFLYALGFMRVYEDWAEFIDSFIAMNAPVDGSGANGLVSPISGYNLNLPIAKVAMRGSESGLMNQLCYLNRSAAVISAQMARLATTSRVFVKKLPGEASLNFMYGRQYQAEFCQFQTKRYAFRFRPNPKAAEILLNEAEKTQLPHRAGLLKFLSQAVPNSVLGVEFCRDFRVSSTKLDLEEMLQYAGHTIPHYEGEWRWEVFGAFGHTEGHSRQTPGMSSPQQTGEPSPQLVSSFPEEFVYSDKGRDLYENVLAPECTVEYEDVRSLYKHVFPADTFEGYCNEVNEEVHIKALEFHGREVSFKNAPNFQYFCIACAGISTPVHAVYDEPIRSYQELLLQQPRFISGDGDGLIPIESALFPMFPEEQTGGVWRFNGVKHFAVVHNPQVHQVIRDICLQRSK